MQLILSAQPGGVNGSASTAIPPTTAVDWVPRLAVTSIQVPSGYLPTEKPLIGLHLAKSLKAPGAECRSEIPLNLLLLLGVADVIAWCRRAGAELMERY